MGHMHLKVIKLPKSYDSLFIRKSSVDPQDGIYLCGSIQNDQLDRKKLPSGFNYLIKSLSQ